jgi:hypothetical protein
MARRSRYQRRRASVPELFLQRQQVVLELVEVEFLGEA